jgi:hypothetical protein
MTKFKQLYFTNDYNFNDNMVQHNVQYFFEANLADLNRVWSNYWNVNCQNLNILVLSSLKWFDFWIIFYVRSTNLYISEILVECRYDSQRRMVIW